VCNEGRNEPQNSREVFAFRETCSSASLQVSEMRPLAEPELQGLNDIRILGITKIRGWEPEYPASDFAFGAA
jgi:hypothetical protein